MNANIYINAQYSSDLIEKIIKCATEVHKFLGNGFQEAVYRQALAIEFELRNVLFEREFEMPLYYKGEQIGSRQVDFFVDDKIMVEIKAISQLEDVHVAQAINFLEAYNKDLGLLINFGSKNLDFKSITNKKYQSQL